MGSGWDEVELDVDNHMQVLGIHMQDASRQPRSHRCPGCRYQVRVPISIRQAGMGTDRRFVKKSILQLSAKSAETATSQRSSIRHKVSTLAASSPRVPEWVGK
jgi:hypothetical protein